MKAKNEDVRYMSVKEFRELGFLQEVNRLILHPCGLALEVQVHDDGHEEFGRIWDYRDDPEGVYFDGGATLEKANGVTAEVNRHREARVELFRTLYPGVYVSDPTIEPVTLTDEEKQKLEDGTLYGNPGE